MAVIVIARLRMGRILSTVNYERQNISGSGDDDDDDDDEEIDEDNSII